MPRKVSLPDDLVEWFGELDDQSLADAVSRVVERYFAILDTVSLRFTNVQWRYLAATCRDVEIRFRALDVPSVCVTDRLIEAWRAGTGPDTLAEMEIVDLIYKVDKLDAHEIYSLLWNLDAMTDADFAGLEEAASSNPLEEKTRILETGFLVEYNANFTLNEAPPDG